MALWGEWVKLNLLIKAYIHDIVVCDSAFSYRILAASFNTTVVNRVNKSEDQNISLITFHFTKACPEHYMYNVMTFHASLRASKDRMHRARLIDKSVYTYFTRAIK